MSDLLVSSHIFIYINGVPFGRVASFNFEKATPRKAINVIDTPDNVEMIQTAYNVSGNMTIYKLHADGGIEAAGMVACQEDLTRERYFSILIIDRVTDTVIFESRQCSVEKQSWSLGRGLIMGQISFSSLSGSGDADPSTA